MSRSSYDEFTHERAPAEDLFVTSLAKQYYPEFRSVSEAEIVVKPVTGGLTNRLYLCCLASNEKSRVLVRLFGRGSELVIDRPRELQVFQFLSDHGQSPKLIATFPGGRLEEFIESTSLYGRIQQPALQEKIAFNLARFHQLNLPGERVSVLFPRLEEWLNVALRMDWGERAGRIASLNLDALAHEVTSLKGFLSRVNSPVVFSHNDLLGANLLEDTAGRVVFIDFEYGEYNTRGFDIANHFCEYAGFDCDYSLYPSREVQYNFFRTYLAALQLTGDRTEAEIASAAAAVSEQDLDALYREVNPFALAAHLTWGMWSLVMAQLSTIDFDYIEYAGQRFNEYFLRRAEFLELIDGEQSTSAV